MLEALVYVIRIFKYSMTKYTKTLAQRSALTNGSLPYIKVLEDPNGGKRRSKSRTETELFLNTNILGHGYFAT